MIALMNQLNFEEILEYYRQRCYSVYKTEESAEKAFEEILVLIEEGATEFEVVDYFELHRQQKELTYE